VKFLEWFLLALCLVVCFSGLYVGMDAHYSFACFRFGFTEAEITLDGVVCSDRTGLEVWLRDLENIKYGVPDGRGL
jgi:hypothetical protein